MKRQGFLTFLGGGAAGAALFPVVAKIPQQPAAPAFPLPQVGQEHTFVEDVYETPPFDSALQSAALPAARGTRLVLKRWSGKRWEEVKEIMPLDSWRRRV